MSDFRKADSTVYETFLEMIEKVFPELSGYSFGLLYREKIKKSRGRMIFAEICLPGKLLSYFARNDNGNPYDFLIVVDEMVWATCTPQDRIRIMRHELRHVYISEKGAPKLVDHDFQDFYAEVDLNADDPSWTRRVAEVADAAYDQLKNGGNDARLDRKDAEDVAPVTKDPQRQVQIDFNRVIKEATKENLEAMEKEVEEAGSGDFSEFTEKSVKEAAASIDKLQAESLAAQKRASEKMKMLKPKKDPVMDVDALARKRGLLPPEKVQSGRRSAPASSI